MKIKGVIPYKEYPKAPEGEKWDGPAEVKKAEVDDLKVICTWFDSENPDIKSSYKLPHHKAKGYKLVWRGVSAAMGALLGARGGVDVPDDDKKGIYNHLVKHYAEFEKDPPEFKEYSEKELKVLEENDFVALEKKAFNCECLDCGHTIKTDEHCADIKCPKCGGEMRRKERPGPGKEGKGSGEKDEVIEADFAKGKGLDKNIGKHVYLQFSAKVKDLGDGFMEAVIASESLDRHGEKIDMKGMNVKNYMKNPVIAAFHNYDEPSVGRTHKLTKTADGKLIAKFEWAKDVYDKAKLLYDLYKEKFQYAFSIGFIPSEIEGNTYTKSEMLEFSPVLIPANAEALLLAKKNGINVDKNENRGIDIGKLIIYNKDMDLKKILEKEIGELTLNDIKVLKDNVADISESDKKKFADVLEIEKKETKKIKKTKKSNKNLLKKIEKLQESVKEIKDADPILMKNINDQGLSDGEVSKEMKFLLYARGIKSGNFAPYLKVVGKDAMNTGDDSVVLPPAEFIAEVERLEEDYGVARKFANLRRSNSGNGLKYLQGDDDLNIYFTDEAGVKTSTKLSYAQKLLAWRKAAGILPITDELTEDSAIDLWNDATKRFARAFARTEDELVFTQATGATPINPGILFAVGVNAVTLTGDSFEDLEYDDLVDAHIGVPTKSAKNGRYFLNRQILGVIQKIKDEEGRPLWQRAMADGTPATILGYPYEETEVLPDLSDDDEDTPFMVFGDLSYVTLGERKALTIKIFDTGSVIDPDDDEADLNLLTQDMQAMRAVKRLNAIVRFPSAFSVVKTGSSAS